MRAWPALILLLSLTVCPAWAEELCRREWAEFKAAFMSADGRIIDWQNGQRSHSEGQGYAMLLAVIVDDRQAFDLAFTWSENNLGHGLRAWSWGKTRDSWGVIDPNNAADGDILHAGALLRAGKKWGEPAYTRAGLEILALIRRHMITPEGIILPGRFGFATDSGMRLNLSYWIFPALRDFCEFDPEHALFWQKTYAAGRELVRQSADKATGLVPDWIEYSPTQGIRPSPAEFGYEAVRAPLYLALAGEEELLRPMRPFIIRVADARHLPDRLNLNGTAASENEALFGAYAVLARAAGAIGLTEASLTLWEIARARQKAQKENYYGTVLYLLALLG